jgi:hypothetical protein
MLRIEQLVEMQVGLVPNFRFGFFAVRLRQGLALGLARLGRHVESPPIRQSTKYLGPITKVTDSGSNVNAA